MHTRVRLFPVSPATNRHSLSDLGRCPVSPESVCRPHTNVLDIRSEDVGAEDFAVHTWQSVLLPTVEQQVLPFSLQGKGLTQAIQP